VGCGGDDDDSASGDSSEFCDGFLDLNQGDPTVEEIRDVAATAPGEGKEALETIADGFEEEGEAYFEGSEFGEHFATVNEVAADECATSTMDVQATEYEFDGVPEEVEAGIVAVNFSNEGEEFHEFAVARKKDDTEESFDELLEMEEDEAEALIEQVGQAFSEPGSESKALLSLEKPGEYVAVCFVPVGSTPDNEEADGPPHFTQGMKVEFSVS
jgi:plastocyanin